MPVDLGITSGLIRVFHKLGRSKKTVDLMEMILKVESINYNGTRNSYEINIVFQMQHRKSTISTKINKSKH